MTNQTQTQNAPIPDPQRITLMPANAPVINWTGEAPASLNFFGITEKGWNIQLTMRDSDEDNLIARFARLIPMLDTLKISPKPVGQQPQAALTTQAALSAPAPTFPPTEPEAPPVADRPATLGAGSNDLNFDAAMLVLSLENGKTNYRLKGGQFSQFGLRIWPEVLRNAGFDLDKFDPRNTYDMRGWKAYYALNENSKPSKVTSLIRSGG